MTGPVADSANPANAQQPGGGVSLFTQEQVNAIAANTRREALQGYFKDLGLNATPSQDQLKQVLTDAQEYQRIKQGEKGDVERLTSELAAEKEKSARVSELELQLNRAKLAADAGLKSRYWKYLEGDNDDAIKASVQETLGDIRGGGDGSGDGDDGGAGGDPQENQGQQPQQRRGTGASPLTPNPQQGAGGGAPTGKSMASGMAAYKAKHGQQAPAQ